MADFYQMSGNILSVEKEFLKGNMYYKRKWTSGSPQNMSDECVVCPDEKMVLVGCRF